MSCSGSRLGHRRVPGALICPFSASPWPDGHHTAHHTPFCSSLLCMRPQAGHHSDIPCTQSKLPQPQCPSPYSPSRCQGVTTTPAGPFRGSPGTVPCLLSPVAAWLRSGKVRPLPDTVWGQGTEACCCCLRLSTLARAPPILRPRRHQGAAQSHLLPCLGIQRQFTGSASASPHKSPPFFVP